MPNPGPIPNVDILSGLSTFISENSDLLQQKVDGKGKSSPAAGSAKKNNAALGNFRDDFLLAVVDAIEKQQLGAAASSVYDKPQVKSTLAAIANASIPVPLSLWNLDGTLVEEVVGGVDRDLTIGFSGQPPAWEMIDGVFGTNPLYAAFFDGESGLEATGGANPGSIYNIPGDMTTQAWVRTELKAAGSDADNDETVILSYGNRSSSTVGVTTQIPYSLRYRDLTAGGQRSPKASYYDAVPNQIQVNWLLNTQNVTVPDGKWVHLAMTRFNNALGDNDLRLFINGEEVASLLAQADAATPTSANMRFLIGFDRGTTREIVGTIRDVAIWNSTLTPAQIRSMYQIGIGVLT